MRLIWRTLVAVLALSLLMAACGDDDEPATSGSTTTTTEASDTAKASISAPMDGATVARRFVVEMAATGIDIEAAGQVRDGAGHFHVMVDAPCVEPGEVVPKDDQHLHFGNGQTEAQLFLEPGDHELCLQVADGAHTALDVTEEISVTVDGSLPYVTLGVPAGATVSSPVALTMEAHGVEIEPAGEVRDGAGHFHVLVDVGCVGPGETIPKDDEHVHFGDGSTSSQLELSPGEHTLCLQVGDGAHEALALVHWVTLTVA